MAFKLNKADSKRKDDYVTALQEAAGKLEDALAEYNAELAKRNDALSAAINDYNNVVQEARSFVEDIASQADSDFSDKSERWQDSENGQAASAWRDEWEGVTLDDIELEFPEELEIDDVDHADTLDQLQSEAG